MKKIIIVLGLVVLIGCGNKSDVDLAEAAYYNGYMEGIITGVKIRSGEINPDWEKHYRADSIKFRELITEK